MEIKELIVNRIKPEAGEVLAITVRGDNFNMAALDHLKDQIQELFPDNPILLLGIRGEDEVKFHLINASITTSAPKTQSYCTDCNCGKKEGIENG